MHLRATGLRGLGLGGSVATVAYAGILNLLLSASVDAASARAGTTRESVAPFSQNDSPSPWQSDRDLPGEAIVILESDNALDVLIEDNGSGGDQNAPPNSVVDLVANACFLTAMNRAAVPSARHIQFMHANIRERAPPIPSPI